jgi:hypothetical protein
MVRRSGRAEARKQASAWRTYGATARREVKRARGWSGQRDAPKARLAQKPNIKLSLYR